MAEEDASLAKVEIAIMRAIGELRDDVQERLHQVDIKVEALANNTAAWQQSMGRHLTEIDRRIGGNEAAINATMDRLDKLGERTRAREDEIQISVSSVRTDLSAEIQKMRADVEADQRERKGHSDGIESLRRTIAWGTGVLVAGASLVTWVLTNGGIGS